MPKGTEEKSILAIEKKISIGIDVHKQSWNVTAVSEGISLFNGNIPPYYDVLKRILHRFPDCDIQVVYEAGCSGFGLYDLLDNDGIRCIVVSPSLIPIQAGNKVKTDKKDSRKLATLLEAGMLKEIFVLSEEQRMHRELLRTRRQLVHHRADIMRQIKSKLLFHSLNPDQSKSRKWTVRYLKNILELRFPHSALRTAVEILLENYDQLSSAIRLLNREIYALAKIDKYRADAELLMTVPGIGRLTAMEILTELGDLSRFESNDKLASFLGLTPAEYSSGEHIRKGRITRCGNKRVRTCLIESSWKLIAGDAVMREKYEKIKCRSGAKRAIVAVARNLSGRIRGMMLRREQYVTGVC